MSLPYYRELGWEAEVICVDEKYVEGFRDELLNETVPNEIIIHKIKALPAAVTRKFGLGSLSLRSYYYFKKKGTALLKEKKFDLVFFSTTMFHVLALGRYWREKFGVPFIVDMQDPWRNDFFLGLPNAARPPKFKIAYAIHKRMEAYTMPYVNGIISVSKGYIDVLQQRYPNLRSIPSVVIPFGLAEKDFEFVKQKNIPPEIITQTKDKINVVYVGAVVPQAFLSLLKAFFLAFKKEIADPGRYHFYFIGTSYAIGEQVKVIEKLAKELHLNELITEVPERIPYFSALSTLMHAAILLIPGSVDKDYNASKVFNNIYSGRPIFSFFNKHSLVKDIIEKSRAGIVVGVEGHETEVELTGLISEKMISFQTLHYGVTGPDISMLDEYSARNKTKEQILFFNEVVENNKSYKKTTPFP
jgi:hypothetical protein